VARRFAVVLAVAILVSGLLPAVPANAAQASGLQISLSEDFPGCVLVRHPGPQYGRVKAIVQKGEERYTYDIRLSDEPECLPLQMGEGTYTIRLMRHVTGNTYREIGRRTVKLEGVDEREIFLASVQNVAWKDSEEVQNLALELTEGCETDSEKVERIYGWILENIKYDYEKARTVQAGYLPDLDQVLRDKKGICYDYASLFAGLLRAVGIPAKLVTGYVSSQRVYHAWNEVYDGETWQMYDVTRAVMGGRKVPDLSVGYEVRYVF